MHAWPCVAAEATLAVRTALHGAGRQAGCSQLLRTTVG